MLGMWNRTPVFAKHTAIEKDFAVYLCEMRLAQIQQTQSFRRTRKFCDEKTVSIVPEAENSLPLCGL